MVDKPFASPEVAAVFAAYPETVRARLMTLRSMIFATAAAHDVGRIEETLKWGQPAYLTAESKSGVTIRIDEDAASGGDYALYVHCNSSLVADWRERYPELTFGGNRSVRFRAEDDFPTEPLGECIAMALTYHRRKKISRPGRR